MKLVFADNFSNNSSGWGTKANNNQTYMYRNGDYLVSNNKSGVDFWVWNSQIPEQTNFVAEVDTKLISSDNDSSFGLFFQLDDQKNHYAFTLSSGSYEIWSYSGQDYHQLKDLTPSEFIKTDGTVNRLKVARLDKTIEVYVNGRRLATVTDDALTKGRIAFHVGGVTSVAFSDLRIYNFTDDYVKVAAPNLLPRTISAQNIGPAGGSITANLSPNSQGVLQITIPKDAYGDAQSFQITTQDFPSPNPNFVAGSPLITIESGGTNPRNPIKIKIPVTYAVDEFPVVFEIDDTGNFQTTTTTYLDKNSIGVTYYIFPKTLKLIVLIARNQTLVKMEQPVQNFKPGKDDWHFENPNTFYSNGNCAGMSLTAIYYYDEIYSKGKGLNLYGQYLGKIVDLDEDDRQALRLVSLVQYAYENSSAYLDRMKVSLDLGDNPLVIGSNVSRGNVSGDEITYKSFVAAIAITKQPQLIFMYGRNKSTNETIAHAMIVYGCNNSLLLADPNNPGVNGLTIPFVNGKLGPYDTNVRNRNSGEIYDIFQFIGRGGAFVSWSSLGDFWAKIDDTSLGDTVFPKYSLKLADDQGKIYTTDVKDSSNISVNRSRIILTVSSSENLSLMICQDGLLYLEDFPPTSHSANVELNKGVNLIGIYVYTYNGTCNTPAWTDFRWVTVTCDPSETWKANLGGSSKLTNYALTATMNHSFVIDFTIPGSLVDALKGKGSVYGKGITNGGTTVVSQAVTSSRYAGDRVINGALNGLKVDVSAPNYGEIWIFSENWNPVVLYSYVSSGTTYQANGFKGFVLVPKVVTNTTVTGDWRTADISGYTLGGLSGTFTLTKQ